MCTAVTIIERLAAGFLQTCCQGYYPSSAGRTLRRGGVHPWSKRGFGALVVAPMQAVLDFIYSDKLEIEVHRLAIATGDGPRQLLLQNGFKLYEHSRMVLWACLDSPLMNHTTCGWQPNGHAKPLPTIGKPLKTMLFAVWFWLGPVCKMVLPVGISHLGWNHVHTFCHFCLCG